MTDYVIEDALCGPLNKFNGILPSGVIYEFINNYVKGHTEENSLLVNLSNLYVMIASYGSERYVKSNEFRWKDAMDNVEYCLLSKHKYMIVGVMNISSSSYSDVELIEWIDTRVRGKNIAYYMMDKYMNDTDKYLVPREIVPSAKGYWDKKLDWTDKDELIEDYPLLFTKDHLNI